ncbi:MAG: hypothetical protein M3137_21185 [Actinomycetota bacterium]|nr:hypothetical protein [Actinomycetota bacterium]
MLVPRAREVAELRRRQVAVWGSPLGLGSVFRPGRFFTCRALTNMTRSPVVD